MNHEQNFAPLPQNMQFYAKICSFSPNYAVSRKYAISRKKKNMENTQFCPNTQFCAKMASRLATKPPPNEAEVVAFLCVCVAPWVATNTWTKLYGFIPIHAVLRNNPQFWPEICNFAQKKHTQFRGKWEEYAVFAQICGFAPKVASRLATKPPPKVTEVVAFLCVCV